MQQSTNNDPVYKLRRPALPFRVSVALLAVPWVFVGTMSFPYLTLAFTVGAVFGRVRART